MIYLRNAHPTARVLVPIAPGWARVLCPAVTASVPAAAVEQPRVRRMLAAQVLAVVDETAWNAQARQRQANRFGMQDLIHAAEQREFDQYRQRHRVARRVPSATGSPGHHAGRWPEEKNARFTARWKAGASLAELAAEFGPSRDAVVRKAQRLGLAARARLGLGARRYCNAWPEEHVAQLRTRWAAGVSLTLLAAELGRSGQTIANKAKRLGLPSRRQPAQELPRLRP